MKKVRRDLSPELLFYAFLELCENEKIDER